MNKDKYIKGVYTINGTILPLDISNLDDENAFKTVKDALNGARIELVSGELYNISDYDLFIDEEGLYKKLKPNPFFKGLCGDVILLNKCD